MKKILGMVLVMACTLGLVTGCGASKQKTMTCTAGTNNEVNGYNASISYKIYYTDKIVDKVEIVNIVSSDDEETLEKLKDKLSSGNNNSENYDGYTTNVTQSDNEVKFETTIDYSKLDLNQLIKEYPAIKSYVDSKNRVTLTGITSVYESLGATCKK